MLVQVLLAVGGAAVVALVAWAASRQRKTQVPRPFDLPTDPRRARGREAEYQKMSRRFKDPLFDEDDQGEA